MPYYPPAGADATKLPLAGGTMTGTITSTLGTVTSSVPVLTATETWNASAVTFTAIKLDITNTTSNGGTVPDAFGTSTINDSRLIDLQVDGIPRFRVSQSAAGTWFAYAQNISVGSALGDGANWRMFSDKVHLASTTYLAFGTSDITTSTTDCGFYRISAGLIGLNAGYGSALLRDLKLRELITSASTTTQASLNIPHGVAPTSPVDGDVWSTTAGLFIRVNGVTKTVTLT